MHLVKCSKACACSSGACACSSGHLLPAAAAGPEAIPPHMRFKTDTVSRSFIRCISAGCLGLLGAHCGQNLLDAASVSCVCGALSRPGTVPGLSAVHGTHQCCGRLQLPEPLMQAWPARRGTWRHSAHLWTATPRGRTSRGRDATGSRRGSWSSLIRMMQLICTQCSNAGPRSVQLRAWRFAPSAGGHRKALPAEAGLCGATRRYCSILDW